jgi:septum formation protein
MNTQDQYLPASAPILVLASASPRRLQLLSDLGLKFEVFPSDIDETIEPGLTPEQVALNLAQGKAQSVGKRIYNQFALSNIKHDQSGKEANKLVVLGADTIVVLNGEIIGKPQSPADAETMLQKLAGKCHTVYTAVAVLQLPTGKIDTRCLASKVYMREMTKEEVVTYVATKEPLDKAGSYALQGIGSAFVDRIDGCYTNIIGLPVPTTVELLRQAGITILGKP